jgi:hypothetical protein
MRKRRDGEDEVEVSGRTGIMSQSLGPLVTPRPSSELKCIKFDRFIAREKKFLPQKGF